MNYSFAGIEHTVKLLSLHIPVKVTCLFHRLVAFTWMGQTCGVIGGAHRLKLLELGRFDPSPCPYRAKVPNPYLAANFKTLWVRVG